MLSGMTSAVLNRNESTFMRKSVFSNPHLNPNPNPNPKRSSGQFAEESVPDDSSSNGPNVSMPCERGQFDKGGYLTLNTGSYTRSEKVKLKRRLRAELEQVRRWTNRIESSDQLCVGTSTSSPCLPNRRFPSKKISGTKRQRVPLGSNLMKLCRQLLTKLMKHKLGWIFNTPVDAVGMKLHDYYQIVKKPMDLGTVKSKLIKNMYESPMEFADDVRLTFNNAMLYNPKGHDVHIMAEQLLAMFEGLFRSINEEYEFEIQQYHQRGYPKVYCEEELPESSWNNPKANGTADRLLGQNMKDEDSRREAVQLIEMPAIVDAAVRKAVQVQSPEKAPSPRVVSPVKGTHTAKLPKPKAKDPDKREMSIEEKMKLGAELQELPEEKMLQLLQIVQKRNERVIEGEDDEVELDIESFDTETLWELDRFVVNWKKALSKMRRQGLMVNNCSASVDDQDMVVSDVDVNAYGEGGKAKNKRDDEDIDIGDEMPMSSFPPVVIEKDYGEDNGTRSSSSSGSSSSGSSSSSDSGSESSSGD